MHAHVLVLIQYQYNAARMALTPPWPSGIHCAVHAVQLAQVYLSEPAHTQNTRAARTRCNQAVSITGTSTAERRRRV
jgi:hypothetical protein